MKAKILIGGGSGLVGTQLRARLMQEGYEVRVLTRSLKNKSADYLQWDLENKTLELQGFKPDIVINLAGAGIADKLWTKKRKQELISSRVESNGILVQAILDGTIAPDVFLSASAIGIYGDRADEKLTEESPLGKADRFMVECCSLWENSIDPLIGKIERLIKLRIGIVLSTKGGALPKITMPMHFGLAPYFGNGKQYYSWIHIDDLVSQIIHLSIQSKQSGVFNGVANEPLSLKEFTRTTYKAMGKKAIMFPVPAFALKLFMGNLSNVLLNSNRVYPTRLLEEGFAYNYGSLENAIKDLYARKV